jgi:DNA polymerase III subunit beta
VTIHFRCEKEEIIKALNIVDKAVSAKSAQPILEGIYISAQNNEIILKATNLVLSIETKLFGEVIETGNVVVGARVFHEIISKYSSGMIDFKLEDGNMLKISNHHSKAFLNVMEATDFPNIPIVKEENEITIEEITLKKMINATIFSAAISESKGVLTGLLFEIENNVLNIVSLDAYRLAFNKKVLDMETADRKAIIPASSLREIYKILNDTDDIISLYIFENICFIKTKETKIFTRLLEGDFVKYKSILPKEYQTKIILKTDDLYSSVERASILAKSQNEKVIKCNIDDQTLLITATSENGNAAEIVDIYLQGKDIEISFNSKYLIDALRAIETEEISMEFNTNISPCVIKSDTDSSFLYLILPVHPR